MVCHHQNMGQSPRLSAPKEENAQDLSRKVAAKDCLAKYFSSCPPEFLLALLHCTPCPIIPYSCVMESFVHHSNMSHLRMSSMQLRVVLWYPILSHTSSDTSWISWNMYVHTMHPSATAVLISMMQCDNDNFSALDSYFLFNFHCFAHTYAEFQSKHAEWLETAYHSHWSKWSLPGVSLWVCVTIS